MSDFVKIAVDAMGGDDSPEKVINGIIHNHKKNNKTFFNFFGDKNKIEILLNKNVSNECYEIIHSENCV